MKIFITIALVMVLFAVEKSTAYGEENWNLNPGTCWHFDIRQTNADLEYFGRPLANGQCPGVAPAAMHMSSNKNTNSAKNSNNLQHDTAHCGTIIKPPRVN